jgi:2,3-bisphosphoglycerate-independent phosphoglycerate mutase
MTAQVKPVVLLVLDGWGYSEDTRWNAIHRARKPNWDRYWASCPHMLISCSGTDVGLPDRQMGNSEVGHMHIGAGRLVPQELTRISSAIEDGSFFRIEAVLEPCRQAAARGNALHILGLLSPGGVHSHEEHLLAMMELGRHAGLERVWVHAFLDGRDTPPRSARRSLERVESRARELGRGHVASVVGRYFAMDRNKHWDRTSAAYNLIVDARAGFDAGDPLSALEQAYARGEDDEFVKPTVITRDRQPSTKVADGDVVVFMNFRADRARQLTRALSDPDFGEFERGRFPALAVITLTRYSADFDLPVMFPPVDLENSFGEYISALGIRQLRLAETEKYAHVTFFFNGGEERVFEGEDRILVPSPRVKTYDLAPEMSAGEVTDRLVEAIQSRNYGAIICNFANPDMVGHTGDFEATVKAIEKIDQCLGRIEIAAKSTGAEVLITSDHGNAELMRSEASAGEPGQPHTAHTNNLVPLIYIGRPASMRRSGTLVDIAPTLLHLMGLEAPAQMTGASLVHLDEPRIREPSMAAAATRIPATH